MRNLILLFFCLVILFSTCKKKIENPISSVGIQTPHYSDQILKLFPLHDNTFCVVYKDKFLPFSYHFDRYNSDFQRLKSVAFPLYECDDISIEQDRLVLAGASFTYPGNNITYKTFRTDYNFNILQADSSNSIFNNLGANDDLVGYSRMVKLANGNYVIALTLKQSLYFDSSHVMLAAYTDPSKKGTNVWTNTKKYFDYSQGIYNTWIADMAADKFNNFYVLLNAGSKFYVLRKHAADGALLWQKSFVPNLGYLSQPGIFISEEPARMWLENDRIIISTCYRALYIYDTDGKIISKNIAAGFFRSMVPCQSNNSYLAPADSTDVEGYWTKVVKLDANFRYKNERLVNNKISRQNQQTSAIIQLTDGRYVLAAIIEGPGLNYKNIVFYKLNENMELAE